MLANELRKDYLLNRWVVIAVKRKRRPTDYVVERKERVTAVCPFCPGHERETPPATLVYLPLNGDIKKDRDKNGFRHKNWLIRCVPNLYPAFTPPNEKVGARDATRLDAVRAVGHHEILIESPHHDENPGEARISQLAYVINAYMDRLNELSNKTYVRYVSIFRNYGRDAGASLSHAHSQIIATPLVPRIVEEELEASKNFWIRNGECVFCSILKKEKDGPRFIWENEGFVVFAPWAGIHPFEFWIFPKEHQSTLLDITPNDTKVLARSFRMCFGGLRSLLKDPSYNFGFHLAPSERAREYYHWHLEVYPKLTIWAGFEKSVGVFINAVPPEDAAASLREAIQAEENIS